MFDNLRNSMKKLKHKRNRASDRKRPSYRPFLQQLEDRCLLATNITQYHVDSQSTGANMTETQLTSSNVNAADFGQLYPTVALDGQVYAEPLVLTNVPIAAGPNTIGTPGTYNSVVFVATEHDSLYAIDTANGEILWQRTFLDTTNSNDFLPGATSVTTCPTGADPGADGQPAIGSTDITPEVGITGTPVIDPSTNVLYVVVKTKETVGGLDHYVQRLHAINVADGSDAAPSFLIGDTAHGNTNNTPIYVNGTGDGNVDGVVQFNALREADRCALSLVNGQVYAEWASHGDEGPYHGWVVAWNVTDLSTNGMTLAGVLCTDPNGGLGGVWGGGGGLTFDPDEIFNGQPAFYFETGNGDPRGGNPPLNANGFPTDDDYYESLVKVEADPTTTATNQNANGWGLQIVDYFTPYNVNVLDLFDEDFGSGSPLVLPDSAGIPGHPHLIVAAGKEGTIYLLDRDNLGKFNVNDDNVLNSVYNANTGATTPPVLINGSVSTPAYYHGEIYWVSGYSVSAYSYVVAPSLAPNPPTVPVATLEPTSETANGDFGYVPGSVMVSADGDEDPADAVVWIMDTSSHELHAYSALSLNQELWNSGPGSIATVKFAVPTVANGQVFVGTQNGLQVFGLTGASAPVQAPNPVSNLSAQALSGSSVELTWTDSTVSPNFATNYAIQVSTDNVHFTTMANAGQETTSYTVTGLNQNTTYYFQIVSSNSAGASNPSAPSTSATTTNQTGQTPTAPAGLGATPASGSEVYLTWTNTAGNETGFNLTRATDSLFTQNVVTQTLASAPYYYTDSFPGMSPGSTYYYKIQATNSSGASSTSNVASVSIPNVPPAPTNAAAVQNGNQVVVSWTDHAGPFALGYQIYRSVDGGPYTIYTDLPETSDAPPSTQTFTDTDVPLGYTYGYAIVAENVAGFSAAAYASVTALGAASLSLDNAGNLAYTVNAGVPDRLSVQLTGDAYTVTDPVVSISVSGAGAGFVTGAGTSTVTIPAADVSAMTLNAGDSIDTISIISDAVPITIAAFGDDDPTINLGDPTDDETISGAITNASNGTLWVSGSGTTTINGNLICQGTGGVTLGGTGIINIAGNIDLGAGNLTDTGSGQATISGVISGDHTSEPGLVGTYFNITAATNLIEPAAPSNPAWLGNQTPAAIAQLIGPIDFNDIAGNGFADSVGNPAYYNLGNGNNNNVEARWYGYITIPGSGTTPVPIDFATISDDGSMLYIDGNTVVSNNAFQGGTQRSGLAYLTPGLHTIDIEYFQGTVGATMHARWDPTGGTNFVAIPSSAFSTIQSGLIETGTGTLTLSNTNTYLSATTVDAGTLELAGTIDTGNLTFGSGSTLQIDLVNSAADGEASVTGTASLTGASLSVTAGYSVPPGTTLTIVHTTNGLGGTTFSQLPEGSTLTDSTGQLFTIHYTSTDVTLTRIQAPVITSADHTTFTLGQSGSFTVSTTGFPAPALNDGNFSLPSGLMFTDNGDGTAMLAGTPAAATTGTYTFTITAGNGIGSDATQTFTLTVVGQAPAITSADDTTFTVGQAGSFTVSTTGVPAPALSDGGFQLPAGVTFTDNGDGTATLAGTPVGNVGGTYTFTITAGNGVGNDATQSFALTVDQAPAITSADDATFTVGQSGSFTVTTTGFPSAALSDGNFTLPSGLTFTDNGDGTATLAGTPAAATGSTYAFTITAGNGIGSDATQSFTLTVDQPPAITSADNTTFTVGQSGSFTVSTTGFPAPALNDGNLSLPSGLMFTDNGDGTATLAGTPAAATTGTYAFTITAGNGIGSDATETFTLTVVGQAPAITSADDTTFTVGQAGSFTISTTGVPAPALSDGAFQLPAGVTFTDNGDGTATLAGMPVGNVGGTYTFTITAGNGVGNDATQSFALTVDQAPAITERRRRDVYRRPGRQLHHHDRPRFPDRDHAERNRHSAERRDIPRQRRRHCYPLRYARRRHRQCVSAHHRRRQRRQPRLPAKLHAHRRSGAEHHEQPRHDLDGRRGRHLHHHDHRLPGAEPQLYGRHDAAGHHVPGQRQRHRDP